MVTNEIKHALVRKPGTTFLNCISSHPQRHALDLSVARVQHSNYCKALEELGIELIQLHSIDYADSCFVEDTAIIYNDKALISRMGAESRRGEEKTVQQVLQEYMMIQKVVYPATIEGGDVIHLPNRLISGVTKRTNAEGVSQMSSKLGIKVDTIIDPTIVHLKSYVTFLGKNTLVTTKTYANHPVLSKFEKIVVPKEEMYAANTLAIGTTVLMADGYPIIQSMVRELGFDVISLEMSEFQKCEGALTCLSILF
ncbi:MAG: dimethylarginine dimethylaminohydrolase family protein [Candidatus Hodarchaeota archaeon]